DLAREISAMLLNVKAVAFRLGVSISTVYDLASQRKIPHRRVGAGRGRLLFAEEDIEQYLAACKVEAGSLPRPFAFTHQR
ncbi:MAG TPA: helix-turn-helix domain-containing protein, partial [Gemmataceae bacterium]|nr:helix-turn-helix domain-containing protein [Gemmataceae bacterium]